MCAPLCFTLLWLEHTLQLSYLTGSSFEAVSQKKVSHQLATIFDEFTCEYILYYKCEILWYYIVCVCYVIFQQYVVH